MEIFPAPFSFLVNRREWPCRVLQGGVEPIL